MFQISAAVWSSGCVKTVAAYCLFTLVCQTSKQRLLFFSATARTQIPVDHAFLFTKVANFLVKARVLAVCLTGLLRLARGTTANLRRFFCLLYVKSGCNYTLFLKLHVRASAHAQNCLLNLHAARAFPSRAPPRLKLHNLIIKRGVVLPCICVCTACFDETSLLRTYWRIDDLQVEANYQLFLFCLLVKLAWWC